MKRKFLQFLRKYWVCVCLNIILLVGTVISRLFGGVYIQKTPILSYNLHSIYVLNVIPVYSSIYGCISYFINKKIVHQQILLAITLILVFVVAENGAIWGNIILTPFCMIISILSSLLTKWIHTFISKIK